MTERTTVDREMPMSRIAVADESLEVIEVEPNAILVARDLGRVCPATDDGRNANGISADAARLRSEHDAIADANPRIGGEPFVDRDRSLGSARGGDRVDALG